MPRCTFDVCLMIQMLLCVFAISSSGCIDGPLYAIKQANPYYRNQWNKDRELGPVFEQRQSEIRRLKNQIPSMTSEEQAKWTELMSQVYSNDSSAELRRDAVMALGGCPSEEAERVLIKACSDKVDKVRLAACKALRGRDSEASTNMLATIVQSQSNVSVRLAAIESLGSYQNSSAKAVLRKCLDEKSPAVQYQATVALKEMTGRDFEGNVDSWKQFVDAGGGPDSDEGIRSASLPQRLREAVPFLR